MALYDQPVRASLRLSSKFTLPMVSSLGFGSYLTPYYFALLTLAFAVPPGVDPLDKELGKLVGSFFNRHAVEVQRPRRLLVNVWFQIYFTPLAGVLFTFPSRYWFTIGF